MAGSTTRLCFDRIASAKGPKRSSMLFRRSTSSGATMSEARPNLPTMARALVCITCTQRSELPGLSSSASTSAW